MQLRISHFAETQTDVPILRFALKQLEIRASIDYMDTRTDPNRWQAYFSNFTFKSRPHAFLIEMGNPFTELVWHDLLTIIRENPLFDDIPVLIWKLSWNELGIKQIQWDPAWGKGSFYDKPFDFEDMKSFIGARMLEYQNCP